MSASHQYMHFVGGGGTMDRMLENILRNFLESVFTGVLDFQMVSVIENPELSQEFNILSLSTLIKLQPTPAQRFVGELSRLDELAAQFGADYQPQSRNKTHSDVMRS